MLIIVCREIRSTYINERVMNGVFRVLRYARIHLFFYVNYANMFLRLYTLEMSRVETSTHIDQGGMNVIFTAYGEKPGLRFFFF